MRIAAIDLGTNSFHLVIAETKPNGSFSIVSSEKEMVRLGESGADMKYLTPEAMTRGIIALRRFKSIIDSRAVREILAIATSAIREAENQAVFIRRARVELGLKIDVISGYEEGRLVYLGILQALPIYDKKTLAIDIGGGSTEYVLGERGNPKYIASHKLGAIRLTKHFGLSDKPSNRSIESARQFIVGELIQTATEIKKQKYEVAAGSSGTMQSVAAIIMLRRNPDLSASALRLNNSTIEHSEVKEVIRELISFAATPERKKILGLDDKRADIILAGSLILDESMKVLGIKKMLVSTYALREGIIYDHLRHHRSSNKADRKIINIREASIRHLGENCNYDVKHAEHVADLALTIFDKTKSLHKLSRVEREYLYYAALVHDIGYHISHTEHHLHSYYIISHADLLGFTQEEIEIIANIARYHRKSHPKLKHEGFQRLRSDEHRDLVRKLAAVLRIAEGLDRGNIGNVRTVECILRPSKIIFTLRFRRTASKSESLEIWGAERKKTLFEEVYGREVRFLA